MICCVGCCVHVCDNGCTSFTVVCFASKGDELCICEHSEQRRRWHWMQYSIEVRVWWSVLYSHLLVLICVYCVRNDLIVVICENEHGHLIWMSSRVIILREGMLLHCGHWISGGCLGWKVSLSKVLICKLKEESSTYKSTPYSTKPSIPNIHR